MNTQLPLLLMGLIAQNALAAPPQAASPKGFESGLKTFTNPNYNTFVGNTGKTITSDDDEDDGFDDEGFDHDPSAPAQKTVNKVNQDSPHAANTPSISMGGGTPGGVIMHSEVQPIKIDDESAIGSKEVVTDFNFPDADILDIAKTLGKLTGKNFILDKEVKGRISIISNSPITVGDAWKAFLTALDINQLALIPSGNYIRIARQRDARDKQLKTYTGDFSPDTDALITRVFPLKYLNADDVQRNFRNFMPANARIIPYDQTNTIIVTDTGSNIAKLSKLLEILDVEGYDAGIEVISVKYASAAELSKLIDTLLPGTGQGPNASGGPRFSGGRFAARRTKEGGIINTIISDERTNTLIVHANTKGADQVRTLVAKLDQRLPANVAGGKVQVVYLQFAEAEKIANTLNNLSQSSKGAPGPQPGGTGVNPVQSSLFEGNIKVSPDQATNSLVITASAVDFVTVQKVINKLDVPRDQVYAEVVIMEINLNKDFTFSSNAISPKSGFPLGFITDDVTNLFSNPLGQKGAIIAWGSADKSDITIGGAKVQVPNLLALIKTLQTKSNGNVLATPQILALDNTEAIFETTEKIPVLTTTAVQGSVSQSTTSQNVSLSIKLKPQINKLVNVVKLDIDAKLADIEDRALPSQVQNLAVATLERNAKTSVVVADNDTVVLGGLIRDASSETVSKIPILGDIPILGWLFRSKSTKSAKTNLLIFITPHIIRQYENMRAILDKKLKERDDFLESHTGGEDPLRKYRDQIIRTLPDTSEILAQKPRKTLILDDEAPVVIPTSAPTAAPTSGSTTPLQAPAPIAPAPEPAPAPIQVPPPTEGNAGKP